VVTNNPRGKQWKRLSGLGIQHYQREKDYMNALVAKDTILKKERGGIGGVILHG